MGTIFDRLVPCMSGSSNRTLRIPRSLHSASTLSTEMDLSSAIAICISPLLLFRTAPGHHSKHSGVHRLHGPHVAIALPLGHRPAERLDLPGARGHVVVAEALVESLAQHAVRTESTDRALERAGELGHVVSR